MLSIGFFDVFFSLSLFHLQNIPHSFTFMKVLEQTELGQNFTGVTTSLITSFRLTRESDETTNQMISVTKNLLFHTNQNY